MNRKFILKKFLKKKLLNKIIKFLMINGKKSKTEIILLKTLKELKKKKKNPIKILSLAIHNSKPIVSIKKQKKRKLIQLIPIPLTEKKQISLGLKNLIKITRQNNNNIEKKFYKKLTNELINTSKNESKTIDLKKYIYKIAYENKSLIYLNKKI